MPGRFGPSPGNSLSDQHLQPALLASIATCPCSGLEKKRLICGLLRTLQSRMQLSQAGPHHRRLQIFPGTPPPPLTLTSSFSSEREERMRRAPASAQ